MSYLSHYPPEKRRRIALWCTTGAALILVILLIIRYTSPQTTKHQPLSTIIANGYTTIVHSAQSYFARK